VGSESAYQDTFCTDKDIVGTLEGEAPILQHLGAAAGVIPMQCDVSAVAFGWVHETGRHRLWRGLRMYLGAASFNACRIVQL